jgi:tetratricopeptide (TPR) repeat protein
MNDFLEKYFGHIGTLFTIIGFVISYFLPEKYHFYAGSIVIFLVLIWVSYFLGRKSVKKEFNDSIIKQPFTDALIEFFENKKQESKDSEIIKWGLALSHPLWLSQKYEIRRKIGEFVEEASIKRGNYRALIKVLVDDIGWTNVELLQYDEAEVQLNKAIKLATEHKEIELLAKAYRHLFGLNIRQYKIDAAEKFLNLSLKITQDIKEEIIKNEMLAEYYFAKSTLEHKKGNFNDALKDIDLSKEMYEKLRDKEWTIKILARKGEILISLNRIDEARSIFIKGIEDSRVLQFNRQIVKNLIGLGICNSMNGNNKTSLDYFIEAELLAESIGMYYELELIRKEKIKLSTRK